MAELIWAIIFGALALIFFILSILHFKGKGFLFNNAFIWASKQEKETINKHPYYRQSAIVFACSAALFFCMALECILFTGWLWFIAGALSIAVLVYAIASSR